MLLKPKRIRRRIPKAIEENPTLIEGVDPEVEKNYILQILYWGNLNAERPPAWHAVVYGGKQREQ